VVGIVSSDIVVIGVVAGIPAMVAIVVVLWAMPRSRAAAAGGATAIAVVLIGVSLWAVFRPSGEQAAAGPPVSVATGSSQPSAPPPPTTPGGPSCSPAGTTLKVVARGLTFDTSCLAAPANTAFAIDFNNQDASIPHNVHIFTDDPLANPSARSLFAGDLVTGPKAVTYQVNALPAGTYFFHCDVHPTQMKGTFVVR